MATLDWISVGPVSAERDVDLQKYFYDAGVSGSLVGDPTRFLMLGRKGAGKTAVFLHIKQRPPGLFRNKDVVVPLSTTEYNWRAHAALADVNKTGGSQYRDSWRFVICVEAIRYFTQFVETNRYDVPKALARAHKLLDKLFGSPVPEWSELLRSKVFSLSNLKLPSAGIGPDIEGISVTAGEIAFSTVEKDDSLRSTLAFNIEHLTDYLEQSLNESLDEYRVFVIFDRVDENWLSGSLDSCKQMIGGLIQASEYFTQKFIGRLRPIVFLREDIFQSIDTINDKNKLKMDCSRTLMWDEETLEKLVLERINHFAKVAGQTPIQRLDDLFDKSTVRSRSTPSKYIFQRTFCRPRDIVAYLTKIIDVGKEYVRDGDSIEDQHGKLSTRLIYDAEGAYSEYLHDEVLDEWRTQIPAIVGYLQILTNIKYTTFSPKSFETEFKKVFRSGVQDETIRSILVFLFQVSVLGYKLGESGKRCFRCFYPSRRFEDVDEYLVHFGLLKQLGLTEGRAPDAMEESGKSGPG
jgi:hypothetical protein